MAKSCSYESIFKSYGRNRKFEKVQERVSTFASSCAEKLRKQHSFCSSITVFVMTNRFRTEQEQYQNSITLDLPFATNSAIELSKYATLALRRIFREGYAYKKAGVIVSNFSPDDSEQMTLFDSRDKRHDSLMKERISNEVCKLVAKCYHAKQFLRYQ